MTTTVPSSADLPPYPSLTAIAAVAANGVIGDGEELLWHLPEDFSRFKQITMGGVMIMGRKTYESLGGALRGRTSIVVTRNAAWVPTNTRGCEVFAVSTVAALARLLAQRPEQRWWSAGGGQIYRMLWDYTTHLDISEVRQNPAGPVTFPDLVPGDWRQTSRSPRQEFDFVTYERVGPAARQALEALIAHAV